MVEMCTVTKEASLVSGRIGDFSEIFEMQTLPNFVVAFLT
jgi:hypothetical protein